ncbi:C40 family peptidase [Nocardiopsis prasina]|uniref:C40 family peptidase n=1 Tax=Nocardiopsis prasina TaxID=2015 RepID=UPI000364142A|nr:C40 family peptidase [Nocardiopsis prasina]
MRTPRHHEQTRACRSTTHSGRQAASAQARRRRSRALLVAALAAATVAAGGAPAQAQPVSAAAPHEGPANAENRERVHQSLSTDGVEKAIEAAESHKGKPYAWGGTGPNSFDCSGLVQHSFKQAGVNLPRVAQDQVRSGTRVSYSDARRGDVLYWTDSGGHAYHVAIYLGGDRMIDAPRTGGKISERDVTRHDLAGAVRL